MNFLAGCVFSIEPDLYLAQTDFAHARYEHFFFFFFARCLYSFIYLVFFCVYVMQEGEFL